MPVTAKPSRRAKYDSQMDWTQPNSLKRAPGNAAGQKISSKYRCMC